MTTYFGIRRKSDGLWWGEGGRHHQIQDSPKLYADERSVRAAWAQLKVKLKHSPWVWNERTAFWERKTNSKEQLLELVNNEYEIVELTFNVERSFV